MFPTYYVQTYKYINIRVIRLSLTKHFSTATCNSVTTALIHEYIQNHELEHEEKQEKGHLAFLGSETLLGRSLLHS